MAWDSGRLISPELRAGFASLKDALPFFSLCGLGSLSFRSIAWCKGNFFSPA